jgi:hypothetical protein
MVTARIGTGKGGTLLCLRGRVTGVACVGRLWIGLRRVIACRLVACALRRRRCGRIILCRSGIGVTGGRSGGLIIGRLGYRGTIDAVRVLAIVGAAVDR